MPNQRTVDVTAGAATPDVNRIRPPSQANGHVNGNGHGNGSSRHAFAAWPLAAQFRTSPLPLYEVIDAEFNAAQLRELAKWLDVKLKGASKIGFTEQVVEALQERIKRMKSEAGAVLEGLSTDQQDFVRRMFTVRDHELPLSRSLAMAVWARHFERDAERRLGEMLDALRRRAVLFPTSPLQYGMRDVYYRWLPLGPNVPVHMFDVTPLKTAPAAGDIRRSNFLADFDAFISALLKSGVVIREPAPKHAQSARFAWLREWEHDLEDAERVINSRPGWVPDPQTGITVPALSPFTPESAAKLEDQTGLSQPHCEFMFALACAMQMIETPALSGAKATHLKVRASAIEEWLVLPGEDKLRRAWRAWSEEISAATELRNAIEGARPADKFIVQRAIGARDLTPAVLAGEWCALRRYVARVLRGLPVGAWISWEDLRARLFEFLPECAWAVSARTDWWFAQSGSRARLHANRRDDWNQTLGRVIEQVIGDSMAWFGAVEAVHEGARLDAFRITEIGAWLICTQDCSLPEEVTGARGSAEPIAWREDNTVLFAQPAPERADFIALVRRIADRGDNSFTYLITPASIERALGDGITLEEVSRKFKRAGVPLPKQVSEQFKTAARRFGRVRLYQALTVLELADELSAREVLANTSLARHMVYQISPRAFVLHDEAVDALIEEMQAKGYTPRVL